MQLFETEANLTDDTRVHKRNRNNLLNALIELAPKPSKRTNITPLNIMRSIMRQLAPDKVWQFWSCQGKSGTGKPSFMLQMTKLYRIVCVTFTKTATTDVKTADTTLAEYLKHCQYRSKSVQYRETYQGRYKIDTPSVIRKGKQSKKPRYALPDIGVDIENMEEVTPEEESGSD